MSAVDRLEAAIGYRFRDRALAEQALTHPSSPEGAHNQRLEFLGDAVLQLVVSQALFERSDAPEGALTRGRQRLVRAETVTAIGRDLGIEPLVRRGRGGAGNERRLVGDATEAAFGAVFVDGGWDAARDVVLRALGERLSDADDAPVPAPDSKTALNQECEQRWNRTPAYGLVHSEGTPHEPAHTWELVLPDGSRFRATGRNKRDVQAELARQALAALVGVRA